MHHFSDKVENITVIQKQWTTYLHSAFRNKRATYLTKLLSIIEAEVMAPDGDLQSFLLSCTIAGNNNTPGPEVFFPVQEELRASLDSFPKRTRHIIYSKIYEDKTFAVIAKELVMKEGTVKTIFYEAMREMRWKLG